MGSRREEERNEKIIRGLMKLPPNRKCINCASVGPQYVCTNFWTFICLSCSGIHREFTHRVKSVSMAKFTTQEVRALEQGGNQRARDIYLKDWDWQRMRLPDNSNPDRIREFIRTVYVDKKYAGGRSSDKPPTDCESVKSNDNDMRRPSSYHSYSQSPPYDFQYEDRRYGKQVGMLARRPSDRALFEGKVANFLYSPGHLRDQMHEDRFANESSGSRFSDFSASSTGEFRNDGQSPSSQDTGYSSPSVHHSRNVSAENPQSQLPHRYSNAAPHMDFDGIRRPQRTASSGSFGSFDSGSRSHKSVDSGSLPDAPIERPVHQNVNRQTGASSVAHSAQPYASLPPTSSVGSSGGNWMPSKPVDSGSHSALTRQPVENSGVQKAVSAQPMASTTQDLFDQSTMQPPVAPSAPIDLFAGFNQQTPSVSHRAVDSGNHADVAKEPVHNTVVQKVVGSSSSVPAQPLPSMHSTNQNLFSLSAQQPPVASSPSIDLFAGFDQQPSSMSYGQQIPSITPSPANEGWASFDTPQHRASTFVSNMQGRVPVVFPNNDGIAKGVDRSALLTTAPNTMIPQSPALMADHWHLNAQEVKVPVANETSQSWNAFGESGGCMPNNLFAFNDKPQVASHQFTVPSGAYIGSGTPKDLARGEPERSNPGDMFPGFNLTSGDIAGLSFPAPLQPMAGMMVSQAGKSTNPFDMPYESDFEANNAFMDMSSLQAALPNPLVPTDYPGSLTEPWFPQNSAVPFMPSGPQGGLAYMTGQIPNSQMLNSTPQGPFPPRNPFE